MGLYEDLRQLSDQVRKRQAVVRGEEATKQALILPFIQTIGYDIYDPSEVQPEYIADFAKTRKGPMEKVDYAIHLNGQVAMLIECKATDVSLDSHDAQLARYFNALPSVKVALLTNGVVYRFFTDLQTQNVMDASPFFEFNVLTITEREAELLRPFTKSGFDPSCVQSHAEELIYIAKVTALVSDLLRNPSESFVRYLLGEVSLVPGRVTQKIVDRFVPIVKKSIQTALVSMMAKSLEDQSPAVAPVVAPDPAPKAPVEEEEGSKVVTTERELEVFGAIKSMCMELSNKYPVDFKDTVNWVNIHLGKPSWWFIRHFSKTNQDFLVTKLPPEHAAELAPGFLVEPVHQNIGASRVAFKPTDDITQLRRLVLAAYDDAVRRCEE